jgi:hypothetical protein
MTRRGYIDRAAVHRRPLRFTWDEWNVESTYVAVRPDEVARMANLSKRANCALTIGIGEWILARFDGMDRDPEPAQFLEAAWAINIDRCYGYEIDIIDDEWRGPVRGPISMALTFVFDALFAEEAGPNSSMNPAWAATFARHVLPDATAFDAWLAFCLTRCEAFYPAIPEDEGDWFEPEQDAGPPVPPEALDPDRSFDAGLMVPLTDQFLSALDPSTNPFLATREELAEMGFEGTPYRYHES